MKKNLIKGAFAGIIGSIVATKLKSSLEEVLPVRSTDTDSPPVIIADRITKIKTNTGLKASEKKPAEKKIHWIFGITIGALYGIAAEKDPKVTKGMGTTMGTSLYGTTHASILPALKTEPWPNRNKKSYVANEFIGHIAFGVTTEIIRKIVRKAID
ncbi:DUF1440 domain-containing protein [Aquimarina agarivorans]|uniref:DUF1440 domain-containing protein n=1 Tax=Aquimarina agarivorans TaxID=980584 RepID=UPI000248E86C|nr:DUF1440 domain-containing protein [Aquimarina agarivorans]